jgi:hypothetical protein
MGKTFSTGLLTNGIWQDASNNIGIGGSPSGSYKFEVTGTGRFTGALMSDNVITSQRSAASLPSSSGASQSAGHRLRLTTDGAETAVIDYGTAGASGGWIQVTNKANLATNYPLLLNPNGGNVGIGTSSPDRALTVNGQIGLNNDFVSTKGGTTFRIGYEAFTSTGGVNMFTESAIPLVLGTNSTERMRISSTGNVGIGAFSYNYKLAVYNSSNGTTAAFGGTSYGIRIDNGGTFSSGRSTIFGVDNSFYGSYQPLSIEASSLALQTTTGGFVGIQTSSPNCPLNVLNLQSSGGYPSLGTIGTGTTAYFCNNNQLYGMLMGSLPSGQSWIQVARTDNQAVAYNLILQPLGGAVTVTGSLSKGSGSFKIDHPIESMKDTHYLVHSFVESPQANNIYRGKVKLINGKAEINLDAVSTMTEGTFVLLNREIHTYTSNETDWDAVRGNVEGNILTIECQNQESNAMVSWLVIGERQDKHMMDTEWTDENGKVIVEPLKEITALENKS